MHLHLFERFVLENLGVEQGLATRVVEHQLTGGCAHGHVVAILIVG